MWIDVDKTGSSFWRPWSPGHATSGVATTVPRSVESIPSIPSTASRIAVAAMLGVVFALAIPLGTGAGREYVFYDFHIFQRAAQAVLGGQNPYRTVVGALGTSNGVPIYFYPLPSALLVVPLAGLAYRVAGAIFVGASCGLLAFAVSGAGWWRLLLFASASLWSAAFAGQMTILVAAGVFLPSLAWLGVFKPNIGIGLLARLPSWRAIAVALLVMGGIAAASLAVAPSWISDWLAATARSRWHVAPITSRGGVILLLALCRWRRGDARLLLALAVMPASPLLYDALPLFVIPANRLEMIVLCLLSFVAYALMPRGVSFFEQQAAWLAVARPVLLSCLYLPALIMILCRPNVAEAPRG